MLSRKQQRRIDQAIDKLVERGVKLIVREGAGGNYVTGWWNGQTFLSPSATKAWEILQGG